MQKDAWGQSIGEVNNSPSHVFTALAVNACIT